MDLTAALEATRAETLRYFELGDTDLQLRYGPGKWRVREVLHHVCDAETVLFDRIRRVISEPRQVIWGFDQNAWARGLGYADRPLRLSREIYRSTRDGIMHYATLHCPANVTLEFVHSETGVRTLGDEFEKVADHNEHHLEQIRLALKGGS